MKYDAKRTKTMVRGNRVNRKVGIRTEPKPYKMIPIPPDAVGDHKILQIQQDIGCAGGQRIQIISAQGHEIILFDAPSGMSKIQITTSDGSQQITMDEIEKKFYIGVADKDTKIIVESDASIEIRSRQEVMINAPKISIHANVQILGNLDVTGKQQLEGDFHQEGKFELLGDMGVTGLTELSELDESDPEIEPLKDIIVHRYKTIVDAIKKVFDQNISHPPIDPVTKEKCRELMKKQMETGIINEEHIVPFMESYEYTSEVSETRESYTDKIKPVNTAEILEINKL